MKKIVFLTFLFFSLTFFTSFAQTIHNHKVFFSSDDHSLQISVQADLADFKKELAGFSECSLEIIGHTDQDGSIAYNMELSKMRAQEVKQFLLDNDFKASNITVSFHGESDLAMNAVDEESKRQNRRVTIIATGYEYNDTKELVSQLVPEKEDSRIVDQKVESNFSLSQGTEVKIPSNAFCHLDGTPLESDLVELKFKEAFDYLDMVDERLFTQTGDQLLETGGMIFIEASQNGQPVKLQNGKNIELLLPVQELKDGMELFTASEDENGIIWDETGEEITTKKVKSLNPDIKVDLSPLLDFVFPELEVKHLTYPEMIPYPNPARISYPPYRGNYTDEEYEEALRKYNEVMKIHEEDKIDRPQRLAQWENEVTLRKLDLYEHKKNMYRTQIQKKIEANIVRLHARKNEVCNERLVDVLFGFLYNEVGRIGYDNIHFIRKTFDKGLGDVMKHAPVTLPMFEAMDGSRFCPELMVALREVNTRIEGKKLELGIVDNNNISRYLMTTSNLGWINCDRFYQYSQDEKMELQFASVSNDVSYYLIFKNIKSLVRPSESSGKVVFSGVPRGHDVRLVGVSVVDGVASLASQDLTLGSKEAIDLSFSFANMSDLREALKVESI